MNKAYYEESAFPLVYDGPSSTSFCHNGLTKREYFAGQMMAALISKYNLNSPADQDTVSQLAVELTDTLLSKLLVP